MSMPTIVFSVDPALLVQLLLAVIMPIVVALVSTRLTSSAKKTALLAGLTLATSLLTGLGDAIATRVVWDIGAALMLALPQFCISVAMYFGLWKPSGAAKTVQDIEVTTLVR